MPALSVHRFPQRHPVWTGVVVAVLLLILVFDWNWLRRPVAHYISAKTEREFRMSHLDVDFNFSLTPTISLTDVYFANAPWGRDEPMAQIGKLEFQVYLPSLFQDKILIPRLALADAQVVMELAKDNRRNWRLAAPDESGPGRARISTLAFNKGSLRFYHYGRDLEVAVDASTFDPKVEAKVTEADARPDNDRYSTQYAIAGKYLGADFTGQAWTGDTLSFQQSGVPFPLKGNLRAGTTRLDVDGTITDMSNLAAIDTQLKIQGSTLANLYPFLLLPLPASPPYVIQGRLKREGERFSLDSLAGRIGATDVTGSGAYVRREPRPLLTADLRSKLLKIADLGPLIGVESRATGAEPALDQAQTGSREAAKAVAPPPDKLLPGRDFEAKRFRAIDAEVDLVADKLEAPGSLPFDSMKASLRLHDGLLKLAPLDVGFAGGAIVSTVTLDGRKDTLAGDARIDLRQVRLERVLPKSGKVAPSSGRIGGNLQLAGAGNSVADLLAKSNGKVSLAVSGGRVSNLVDAASGLNGGKVLSLLVGGDQDIAVRCGAASFDIKNGQGKSTLFVVDTEQTQILGEGGFDLGKETFDFKVSPQPKEKGFLSLRTPVRLHGTFRKPTYDLEKGPMAARAAGAVALAVIAAPLAALLPFIETGPGEETDCSKLMAQVPGATQQATPARGR